MNKIFWISLDCFTIEQGELILLTNDHIILRKSNEQFEEEIRLNSDYNIPEYMYTPEGLKGDYFLAMTQDSESEKLVPLIDENALISDMIEKHKTKVQKYRELVKNLVNRLQQHHIEVLNFCDKIGYDKTDDFEEEYKKISSVSYLKCKRCNHRWQPRGTSLPKYCPKCKSPYWDKDRIKKS